jgi:putative chitinase
VTPRQLAAAVGSTQAKAELYAPYIDEACDVFQINTPARLAAFLAQIGHESGSLTYTCELASGDAYEGRADLGNTEVGDGRKYRGHGLIQTTGRFNTRAVTNGLRAYGCPDFEEDPEALMQPRWAALSAAWYWQTHGCNELADTGQFDAITKRINGGLNGKADRDRRWEKAKAAIGQGNAPTVVIEPADEPPKEKKMPFPAIIAALLPALIQKLDIPKLIDYFKPGVPVPERNVAMGLQLWDVVKTAVGAVNEQEVIQKMDANPAVIEVAKKAVQDQWFQIFEVGAGGIGGAKAFIEKQGAGPHGEIVWQIIKVVSFAALGFLALANLMASAAWAFAIWRDSGVETATQLLTQVITADIGAAMTAFGFWLGSSWGSRNKDQQQQQQQQGEPE